jgi:hypothetical protein
MILDGNALLQTYHSNAGSGMTSYLGDTTLGMTVFRARMEAGEDEFAGFRGRAGKAGHPLHLTGLLPIVLGSSPFSVE